MGAGLATLQGWGAQVFVSEAPRRTSARGVAAGLGGVAALSLLAGWRAAPIAITTTVWAEDGREFLAVAVRDGTPDALFRGYAGYAHVLPRLLAAVAAAVPAANAAFVLAVEACVVVGLLAWFCGIAARGHLRHPLTRATYALCVVLLPVVAIEGLGNIANLHWFLLVAAFWALVWRPSGRAAACVACAVVAAAALSDPLVALFVPLAVWRAVVVTTWRDRAVVIALFVSLAAQVVAVLRTPGEPIVVELDAVPRLFAQRVITGSLTGVRGTVNLVDSFGAAGAWTVAFAVVAAGAALWWKADAPARAITLVGAFAAMALYAVAVGLRGDSYAIVNGVVASGSRYTIAPALLLVGAGLALIQHADRRVVVLGVAVLATWTIDVRSASVRSEDLTWARGIAQARTACRFGQLETDIPTLPLTPTVQWVVHVPCAYVGDDAP